MATIKQIRANRRNAPKSTGPQSPEAKERVRFNVLRAYLTQVRLQRAISSTIADLQRYRQERIERQKIECQKEEHDKTPEKIKMGLVWHAPGGASHYAVLPRVHSGAPHRPKAQRPALTRRTLSA